MSVQLQSTATVLSVSLEKTEYLTIIKNEPLESEIGIDDIPNSLDEEIILDIKDIDIESHALSEDLIKSEPVSENILKNNYSGSVEAQVFVKTENTPYIKTEDPSDGNVSSSTNEGVIEVQRKEGSNEQFNALGNIKSNKQLALNFSKDLSNLNISSRKAKHPDKTDFSECYKTVATTSCEKDKKKGKVIEVPVILIEPHKYTSLAKAKHACNKNKSTQEQNKKRYCCEKCTFISENHSYFKRHKLSHKTKIEVDSRYLKYRCDKCKYKTCWSTNFKTHKLTHLKPEEIHYFYCYHCSYKSKHKANLQIHIFRHFKNEDVPFHCYICDFVTLKRDLIIEHFKKHPKHHSKCDETDYKNQLEPYTNYRCDKCKYKSCWLTSFKRHKLIHLKPQQISYFYCYHCPYKCKLKNTVKIHIFNHFKNEEVSFHCYICDFTTLKRNLIIEHFKKHPKHHNKCDEPVYKNQLKTYTKKQMSYGCKKCSFRTYYYERFKLHELTHKTEMDDQHFKYRCDKCKYKTFRHINFKTHKLIHLKPEDIHYFYCYHCSYKSKHKGHLKNHIFRHFKNEDVPFHCYICDFVTLKRDLIIEHFETHPKNRSKYDETKYKYQLENCNKRYGCKKCSFRTYYYESLKLHELTHKTEMDDRHFKYRCDKCKYKTFRNQNFKRHKLIHLTPEEIEYFYCYHCSYKSNIKQSLKVHISRHFKNEEIPFNCYICDFVTLKRESFKKHLKHHNKCDETVYRNQLLSFYKIL